MRNARTLIAIAAAVAGLAGCSKGQDQRNQDQNMAIDEGMPGGIPANADIETLPADESSTTPSNQLQNGIDGPDVNETATSNAQ